MPRILGHTTIINDLKRLADKGTLAHGYIFFGPAMVGKKIVAEELAAYLEFSPDERGIVSGTLLSDMQLISPGENGSIGIDEAREIKHFLWQKPNVSLRRTLIIDDADRLTTEAQNALLKITEEPPASSLMILITSDIESIAPTILSRFQKIYFGTVPEAELALWLKDVHGLPQAKALALAKKVFGKPGLAIRMVTDSNLEKNLELAERFLKSPKATRRDLIKKIIDPDDFNLRTFLDAVIMTLALDGVSGQEIRLWHKTLALYDRQTNFSLNPRLQLEALLM